MQNEAETSAQTAQVDHPPLPERARAFAQHMIHGFDRHYALFRASSASAKTRFDAGDWRGVQGAMRERIAFYDQRVRETVQLLLETFPEAERTEALLRQAKLHYIGMLTEHKQPELAETFFNSVFCRFMSRSYFHNDFIFVRPAISTEYIEADPPTYRSYYPNDETFRGAIRQAFHDFGWSRPFEDLDRDITHILHASKALVGGDWPERRPNFQLQVLSSAFYRNKAAYIIGRVLNGDLEYPFVVPVLHTPGGALYADTILLDPYHIRTLFSLSRAYFMVDMEVPSSTVQFLRSMMPNKPRAEIYTMLGLGKQGKSAFYRGLISHLNHSRDQFIIAPGIKGLVMLVFTLPSYPYVFKVIKDRFGSSKEVDHATVKRKYQLVKQVDRVGRMADTLEFSQVALPLKRFSPELLRELEKEVPSLLERDGDALIIQHLYIERRMTPLNLHLEKLARLGKDDELEQSVAEYGNAIRELAIANIFPGDLLWKNFGVTRFNRVVFYDYDEIEFMTDCNFRRIPVAPDYETELSGEVWYSVAKNDVFPEEFGRFLFHSEKIRKAFDRHHPGLFEPEFWQRTQETIRRGEMPDFFPYPESIRFCQQG